MEQVLPNVLNQKEIKERGTFFSAIGEKRATVAFFTGCLMDTMFFETNSSTIKLLQHAGCDVYIPKEQACCGALHAHSGEKKSATTLAKRNIEAFESLSVDYIVNNAGGCGAFLHDYPYLFEHDQKWSERALAFKYKVTDISTILSKLDFTQYKLRAKQPVVVTYQDSCHLRNVSGVISEPRNLLNSIDNAYYVELNGADQCCGSAGIYNLLQSEMSMKILDDKMEKVKDTKAAIVITSNPGCLLQMKLGIERAGLSHQMESIHIVDFLSDYVSFEMSE
jgi:glycolate oxidase iron-sulfur subunit